MTGAALELALSDRRLVVGERPRIMGVLNASPDSFSQAADQDVTLDALVAQAERLVADGAELLDVGGESARTDHPALGVAEELERVVPLVSRLADPDRVAICVDTYKPAVAEAAVGAGASLVNDTSGLRDPELAEVCAASGAGLVLMHTVGAPKQKVLDHRYGDPGGEVKAFLAARIELAMSRGVAFEQLVLDPGPDFGKSPAQTVAALRSLSALGELGRPILLAVSRKDFVGALTGRRPRERLGGTLAALGFGVDRGARILRVHDVSAVSDFLAVRGALRGEREVPADLRLAEALRRESP